MSATEVNTERETVERTNGRRQKRHDLASGGSTRHTVISYVSAPPPIFSSRRRAQLCLNMHVQSHHHNDESRVRSVLPLLQLHDR